MMDAADIFEEHEAQARKEHKKVEKKPTSEHVAVPYAGAPPVIYADGGGAQQTPMIRPIRYRTPAQPAPKQNPCVPRQPFAKIDRLPKQLSLPRMKVKR